MTTLYLDFNTDWWKFGFYLDVVAQNDFNLG